MNKRGIGVLFAVAVLIPFTGLNAATITETLTGIIGSGIDNAGIFGPQGASLAGDSATVTYVLNAPLLASHGLYQTLPSSFEELSSTANDGALTNSITVNGVTYSQTQTAGGTQTFSTSGIGSGSVVESNLFNSGSGLGTDIRIQSSTAYQYPTLLSNPQPFLDLVMTSATSVTVDIVKGGGDFETQFVIPSPTGGGTPGGGPVPEPSTLGLVFASAAGGYIVSNRLRRRRIHLGK